MFSSYTSLTWKKCNTFFAIIIFSLLPESDTGACCTFSKHREFEWSKHKAATQWLHPEENAEPDSAVESENSSCSGMLQVWNANKKKSLVTSPFSVIKMKTKLKHGASCNLISAFSGACQVEFCPFSLLDFSMAICILSLLKKNLDARGGRWKLSAKWNPHYVNFINHHIRAPVNKARKTFTNRSFWLFILFYSMLEGTQNDEKKFLQKCEKWVKFLEKMKEALKTDIPGRFEELQEQQRVYEVKLILKMKAVSWMRKAGGNH